MGFVGMGTVRKRIDGKRAIELNVTGKLKLFFTHVKSITLYNTYAYNFFKKNDKWLYVNRLFVDFIFITLVYISTPIPIEWCLNYCKLLGNLNWECSFWIFEAP